MIPSGVAHTEELNRPSDRVRHLYQQVTHVHTIVTSSNRDRITLVEHRPWFLRNTACTCTIIGIDADQSLLIAFSREVAVILEGQAVQQTIVQSQIHLVSKLLDAGKIGTSAGSIFINRRTGSGHAGRHNRHEATIKIGCTGVGGRCSNHSVTLGSQDTLDGRITGRQGVRPGDQHHLITAGTH